MSSEESATGDQQTDESVCDDCGSEMVWVRHDDDPAKGCTVQGYECPNCSGAGPTEAEEEDADDLEKLFTAHDALRQADGKPMPADAKDGVEEAREIIEGMIQSEVAPDA